MATVRTKQDEFLNDIKTNTGSALSPVASDYIADTTEHVGPYFALTSIGTVDAVIDVSECDMSYLGNVLSKQGTDNITIPRGVTIYGNFASVELDSGALIAYKK